MNAKTSSNPVADFLFEPSRLIALEMVKNLNKKQLMEIIFNYCDYHEDFLAVGYERPTEPSEYLDWFLKAYKAMTKIALVTDQLKKHAGTKVSDKAHRALGELDGWKSEFVSRRESMSDEALLKEFQEQIGRVYANIFAKTMNRKQDDSFFGKLKNRFSKKVSLEISDIFPQFMNTYYSEKPYIHIKTLIDEGIYKFEE